MFLCYKGCLGKTIQRGCTMGPQGHSLYFAAQVFAKGRLQGQAQILSLALAC